MKRVIAIAGVILAASATPAGAHRLDEYLQAPTVLLTRDHVRLDMRLAPGVAIVRTVLDSIDTNHNRELDEAEQRAYGVKVLGDLSFVLDKKPVTLRLVSWRYPVLDELRRGMGEILLAFEADVPSKDSYRTITLDNHHRSAISAYLVNGLVPNDNAIHIVNQNRNNSQSTYELTYTQTNTDTASISFGALGQWSLVLGGVLFLVMDQFKRSKRLHPT